MPSRFSLASDNAAPVHPAVMAAIQRANEGPALAYGHDDWTEAAIERIRSVFGESTEALFVFNGTAANVLALRTVVDSYHAVLCAESSHLWRDECNAPEQVLRAKLVPIPTPDGKLSAELVEPYLRGNDAVHHAQPRVISIAQPTEWGTVYTAQEIRALADLAHANAMFLHVDGARFANAAVALDSTLGDLREAAAVDVLSFGGTKLGLLAADAVLLFDSGLADRAAFYRKQAMQLASKMRFIAVQFDEMLSNGLWRELARHANAMASRLAEGLTAINEFDIVRPVQSNAVFVRVPQLRLEPLQRVADFHVWDPDRSIVRLMTAWNTEPEQIDHFLAEAVAPQAIGR